MRPELALHREQLAETEIQLEGCTGGPGDFGAGGPAGVS